MTIRDILPFRERRRAKPSAGLALAGLAAGAAAVALLERAGGARRRSLVVQKTIHSGKAARSFAATAARDLANRSRGVLAMARASVARGVHRVEDRLERHAQARNVPGLQGGAGRPRPKPELPQQDWAPATRLLTFAAGAGLVAFPWGRSAAAMPLRAVGALLALRGATNLPVKRIVGIGAGRRAVDLRKTIHIAAPRSDVFAFFSDFENFPRFMTHVREVRRAGEGRWHWVVEGPGGASVAWDAEVTALRPGELVAWRTLRGAPIASAGLVRLEDEGGGTRLDVRLSYDPPAGALGHAVAFLLGADPKQRMDDDLLRLKSLLERGKAEGVTRDEVRPS